MGLNAINGQLQELLEKAFELGFNCSSDNFNNSHFKGVGPDKLMGRLAEFERRRQRAVGAMHKQAKKVQDQLERHGSYNAKIEMDKDLKDELSRFANVLDRFDLIDRSDW
jgi:hypothetical protein